MRLYWAHLLAQAKEFLRHPGYVISTLVLPSLLFLVFAAPNAEDPPAANLLTASLSAFAVLGVVFFQLSILTSESRTSNWERILRVLPRRGFARSSARATIMVDFSITSAVILFFVSRWTSPCDLSLGRYFLLLLALVAGSLPFAFMATSLALLVRPKSALPIANLAYLMLTFAGGLWMPPDLLPSVIKGLSEFLPTRHYAEILWSIALDRTLDLRFLWGLGMYTVAFGAIVWMLSRKVHEE